MPVEKKAGQPAWTKVPCTKRVTKLNVVSSASSSLLDDDKPRRDDWTLWTSATSAFRCRRWRVRWWRRSGTALGLEEVHVVRFRINGDCLSAGECGNRRN